MHVLCSNASIFVDFGYISCFMLKVYLNFYGNEIIFIVRKRPFMNYNITILEQKFELLTEHKTSVVSYVNKNQRIRTQNMHST